MALYDYKCPDCGEEFEEMRLMRFRNDPIKCKKCSSEKPTRIFKVGSGGFVDPGILNADKNMAISGVEKRLSEMKAAHPYMHWSG